MNNVWLTCADCKTKKTAMPNIGIAYDPDPAHWEFHCGCVPSSEVESSDG